MENKKCFVEVNSEDAEIISDIALRLKCGKASVVSKLIEYLFNDAMEFILNDDEPDTTDQFEYAVKLIKERTLN